MNYLAHFHLAQRTQTSISGALLGDFVKAERWQQFSDDQVFGIKLHRYIDKTIDKQLIDIQLMNKFTQGQRRYAGIVIDLYFDHLLCKHWALFNAEPLDQTIQSYYLKLNQELNHIDNLPVRLPQVLSSMQHHNWLLSYKNTGVTRHALKNIGTRLKRPVALELIYDDVLVPEHEHFEAVFLEQYPWLLQQCIDWVAHQQAQGKV
ncbi:DUF479 domain-containing protein [Alginatibacterium sediminis]|uniref:DUF479 domain-containing protein n=1 Tax=Alginatibacterium sediminis TaxID=2164068 RepID=A0A420E6I6_9ALTE|nr:ACP phosphodiesterase [Alginatibacterium sediminis]RKF13645.1 DUF479 domain-containing protein [Alginatibacterium sediminis]